MCKVVSVLKSGPLHGILEPNKKKKRKLGQIVLKGINIFTEFASVLLHNKITYEILCFLVLKVS